MSSIAKTAVKHPLPSLAVAGFSIYSGYWAIQQLHWMVNHAFTLMLIAAIVTVALTVGGKIKGRVSGSTHAAGSIDAGVPATDWDRLVREYNLPEHHNA